MRKLSGLILGFVLVTGIGAAQMPPQKISGDVVALDGATLRLTSGGRIVSVKLADAARISARSPATVGGITPGAFVGATAVPQADGTLLASEIQIFPESLRGTGEGHRPMAAPAGATMTNATVRAVTPAAARNTMTNATVASATSTPEGRTLKLTYTGGEKVVVVPGDALVFATDVGTRDLLVAGAHVVVYAQPQSDGMLVAERVSVGKDGYVPPR